MMESKTAQAETKTGESASERPGGEQAPGGAARSRSFTLPTGYLEHYGLGGKVSASEAAHPQHPIGGHEGDAPAPKESASATATTGGKGAKPTLSKATISGPTDLKKGGFTWVVQWKLSGNSPGGGWIVQGLNVKFNIKDKAGKAVAPTTKGVNPALWPYWEAWQVNKGKSVTTYAEGGDLLDDAYAVPSVFDNTKGSITYTGSAQFYEGLTLPGSFKPQAGSPAGILPIVRSQPTLAGGTGAIAHNLVATWDCTGADKSTKLAVT